LRKKGRIENGWDHVLLQVAKKKRPVGGKAETYTFSNPPHSKRRYSND